MQASTNSRVEKRATAPRRSNSQEHRPARRRISRPKSRLGCLTCKTRHVKCDEVRPACMRCQATGLACAGYDSVSNTSPTTPIFSSETFRSPRFPSPPYALPAFEGSAMEKRAIGLFHHKGVPLLSGYFYNDFFNDGLLQFGFSDPAVRYSIIAFSAVFENECMRPITSDPTGDVDRAFAIESYNTAIRHLLAHLDHRTDNILIPLMTCVVFVCIDCVRHDVVGAMRHIKGGLKLLDSFRMDKGGQLRGLAESQKQLLTDVVVPVFSWLHMTNSLFGGTVLSPTFLSGDEDRDLAARSKPQNLDQIVSMFLDVVAAFIEFARTASNARYSLNRNPAIAIENLRIINELDVWKTLVDELLAGPHAPKTDPAGLNLVFAAYKAIHMWMESFLHPSEMIWDAYREDFEQILDLVASALDDSMRFPDPMSKSFAFEMPMIPILHFVANKCRWPHIRRRAIDFLRTCPQRECMFTSRYSLLLAEKVMEIEETGMMKGKDRLPDANSLPPAANRIYHMNFPPLSASRHGRAVNFLTKPNGIEKPWSIRTDYINIKSIELMRWFDLTGSLEDHAPELSLTQNGMRVNTILAQA